MRALRATLLVLLLAAALPASAFGATLWAVGDGADSNVRDDALAARIQSEGPLDRLLYLGDVYETGTAQEFSNYYTPSYGRFKPITSPTIGNHEWPNRATGYDPYWGSQGLGPNGEHYYSFDMDGWHVVSLNSEEDTSATSPQLAWLQADLAPYPGSCTILFLHKPWLSTSFYRHNFALEPVIDQLSGRGVLLLSGHHHNYQRFKPERGVTQLVVGTGGHSFHQVNEADARLVRSTEVEDGALRMTLNTGRLDYEFVTTQGARLDSGSIPCTPHSAPENQPPDAGFGYSPLSPLRNQPVTFSSTSSDPDGALASETWDLDNDGQFDDASGSTASRSFVTAGIHTVRLRVEDAQGASDVATRTVVVENQPPNASFVYQPATPVRYERVRFTSTSADPDGSITSQRWDTDNDGRFDDATGSTASRKYSRTGNYTVRLRVKDNDGAYTVTSRVVTVYRTRPTTAPAPRAVVAQEEHPQPHFGPTTGLATAQAVGPGVFGAPSVRIRQPRVLGRYGERLRLKGDSHGSVGPVQLTLERRRGKRCVYFDGTRFRRKRCGNRTGFSAQQTTTHWEHKLETLLPGQYRLTARAVGADGVAAAQSVAFRVR
jgi:PKD repeat protein